MPRAKLDVKLPDGVWISDLSRDLPETTFRVLAALPGDESGVGLLEVVGSDLAGTIREMESLDGVTDIELLESTERSVLVQFSTTQPLLLLSLREVGLPFELPIDIEAGRATLEVVAPHEQLSMLRTQFEQFGMSFDVVYLYESVDSEQLLTERQRELLVAALRNGYYDTPRTCTLTELAEEVGAAKSTVSESLHRAEEKVIKQFAERIPQWNAPSDAA
uniref:helix-turn-helix domain-containing protein n=1 Tax=Haloprofundus sp. MHR1 TaxID=2572921 RepID=UPI001F1A65B9|nr:helix-turn-helix domain-containing protein [Haloprofundus sp. MHR1]